jgi:hypothetical protein
MTSEKGINQVMSTRTYLTLLFVALAFFLYFKYGNPFETTKVTSFVACVEEGNPVMESYPRQCISKAGDHFVEVIE